MSKFETIRTKYAGPTDHKGSRIIASSDRARSAMSYDYALSASENHARAAELHAAESWRTDAPVRLASGILPDGSYAHVSAVDFEVAA